MTFKNTFRTRSVLLVIAVAFMSAPVTGPLAASFVKSGALSLNRGDVAGILHVPAPLIFFPVVGFLVISMAFGSEYLQNRGLRDRTCRLLDEIQGFRLESYGKRHVMFRNPSTGKTNMLQAQAIMDYQRREHAGYLSKFRHSLAELAKEIARHGLSTEAELLTAFFETRDISTVEKQLLSLAEQIGQPKRTISRHTAKVALLLTVLPTIIWALLALVSHAR